jgi:hypothetical protein
MISRQGAAVVPLVTVALLASSGTALAAPKSPNLWATVNICDTLRHPDQMGVRASMPGDGTRERMFMRFRAQFFDATKSRWHNVTANGNSGWISAGSALFKTRELGWTFAFVAPTPGSTYTLRGVVDFQWRAKRHRGKRVHTVVVRKVSLNTKGGFKSTVGADPPGYSNGLCEIH